MCTRWGTLPTAVPSFPYLLASLRSPKQLPCCFLSDVYSTRYRLAHRGSPQSGPKTSSFGNPASVDPGRCHESLALWLCDHKVSQMAAFFKGRRISASFNLAPQPFVALLVRSFPLASEPHSKLSCVLLNPSLLIYVPVIKFTPSDPQRQYFGLCV